MCLHAEEDLQDQLILQTSIVETIAKILSQDVGGDHKDSETEETE